MWQKTISYRKCEIARCENCANFSWQYHANDLSINLKGNLKIFDLKY